MRFANILCTIAFLGLSACASQTINCNGPAPRNIEVIPPQQFEICPANMDKRFSCLQLYGAEVMEQDDKTIIAIPSDQLFELNSATLTPKGRTIIHNLANTLQQYPNQQMILTAHSDSITYQKKVLTQQQATNVAGALWSFGIPSKSLHQSLIFTGKGDKHPIATTETFNGMTLNRRIQIVIKSKQKRNSSQPTFKAPIKYQKNM